MKWYDIGPDQFPFKSLKALIDDVSTYQIKYILEPLKKLGYKPELNELIEFFYDICRSNHSFSFINLLYEIFKLGYDVSQYVIDRRLRKNDNGEYKSQWTIGVLDNVHGYSKDRINREHVKEMLGDKYKKEYELICYYDDVFEFADSTQYAAGYTWNNSSHNRPKKDILLGDSDDNWWNMFGKFGLKLNWEDVIGDKRDITLISYIILIGVPASAIRAGIMGFLVMFCFYIGRLNNLTRSLVFTAVILLLINPKLLRDDIGFQLSFLAVFGIAYLFPKLNKWSDKIGITKCKKIKNIFFITISAQIFIFPILMINFSQVSLISPISNLFASISAKFCS